MGWLSPRPLPGTPDPLDSSPSPSESEPFGTPLPPYSLQGRRSAFAFFRRSSSVSSGPLSRARQGSTAAMLERPRLAVNVEHVSEVRLEPASTGLGLATVHQNEERPPSPTVSDRATIGDPSTSLKQPSLGVVIAPTSPISFNFSHHDPNFACDRHLRRARLIATTPSVLVLGSLLWVGVEAVVSVIRLGTTAGVESVGGRKVVLWVEIGVVTLGVLVVVADIFWILAARRRTLLSPILLSLSYLLVSLSLALSFLLLFLLVASPSLRRQASSRCGWGVDVMWTTHRGGEVCYGERTVDDARVGKWVTAAGIKVAVVFVVGVIWLGLLHAFAQALESTDNDTRISLDTSAQSPNSVGDETDKLMEDEDDVKDSPRTQVLHSLVGSLLAPPKSKRPTNVGVLGSLYRPAGPLSLVDETIRSRSDVVSSTGPEIIVDLSNDTSSRNHASRSFTNMPREDFGGSDSLLSGHFSGHTSPSPPPTSITFAAYISPPPLEQSSDEDPPSSVSEPSIGPFTGTSDVPPWPPSAQARDKPIAYVRMFASSGSGQRLVRKLSTVASLTVASAGSSEEGGLSRSGSRSGLESLEEAAEARVEVAKTEYGTPPSPSF